MSKLDLKIALRDMDSFHEFIDVITIINLEDMLDTNEGIIDNLMVKRTLKPFEEDDLEEARKLRKAIQRILKHMNPVEN